MFVPEAVLSILRFLGMAWVVLTLAVCAGAILLGGIWTLGDTRIGRRMGLWRLDPTNRQLNREANEGVRQLRREDLDRWRLP